MTLAIETSCDDTACAVLDGAGRILASEVSSQLSHQAYGGIVPEIASREHLQNWPPISDAVLSKADVDWKDIDVVAATQGPGLIGSLLVGLSLGKALAYALRVPFKAVHHLEGHLYSPFLSVEGGPHLELPHSFVGLVVSGGHTCLYDVSGPRVTTLAQTRDDAMGESFDKIGKRIGLPFPGGPHVDTLADALEGLPKKRFKVPLCGDSLDFSYSGLKTRTLKEIEHLERAGECVEIGDLPRGAAPMPLIEVLASFRAAAVAQLLDRLDRLYRLDPFEHLAISGGAAANRLLRRRAPEWARSHGVELHLVAPELSSDNAAMIAFAALLHHRRGESDDPRDAEAFSRLGLGEAGSPL